MWGVTHDNVRVSERRYLVGYAFARSDVICAHSRKYGFKHERMSRAENTEVMYDERMRRM